jgi:hypothetical protein
LLIQVTAMINSDRLTCQHWLASLELECHSSDSSKIYSVPRIEPCSIPVESCKSNGHAIINVVLTGPHTLYAFAQKKLICNVFDILLAAECTMLSFLRIERIFRMIGVQSIHDNHLKFYFLCFMCINYVKCNLRMTS